MRMRTCFCTHIRQLSNCFGTTPQIFQSLGFAFRLDFIVVRPCERMSSSVSCERLMRRQIYSR